MANSTSGLTWTVDSVGLLTDRPVKIRKIQFYPNTEADSATFKYYDFGSATEKASINSALTTISTNTIASTANFVTGNVAAGDGLRVKDTNTGNNIGNYYVVSRDNDNQVTVTYATMTDESNKRYTIATYTQKLAFVVKGAETEKQMQELDFGDDGRWFASLACTAISSASDLCYIFIL
jgi:hypothetical protein